MGRGRTQRSPKGLGAAQIALNPKAFLAVRHPMRRETDLIKILTGIWIMIAIFALRSNANAQSNLEQLSKMRFVARVDFECANKKYPKQRLSRLVREAMKDLDADISVYGNSAFGFDLNKDGKLEYFIPLDCGVSNCMWGIFTIDPPRLLAKIAAERIYIERGGGWPVIATYVHASADDGVVSVYKYSKSDGYLKSGEDSDVNLDRKDFPASMQAARSICGRKNPPPVRRKPVAIRSDAHE
jgi:hypothetical protein